MNFGQAFKMAFKSLGSKKLRTFLTMLGVIIGVTCVALLSTVTSGAKDYIVGTLKKESQVVNMMMMGADKPLTHTTLEEVAASIDKDKCGDFIFAPISQGTGYAKVNGKFSEILPTEKKGDYTPLYNRSQVRATSIIATNELYDNVRNLTMVGRFLENGETDKCTINQEFLDTYYPKGTKPESLLGTTIELGASANVVRIELSLVPEIDANTFQQLFTIIINTKIPGQNSYFFGTEVQGTEYTDDGIVLVENFFENYSGYYLKQDNGVYKLVLDIDTFMFTDEQIITFLGYQLSGAGVNSLVSNISVKSLSVQQLKAFEIVGVITNESNMFNSMGSDMSIIDNQMLSEILERTSKGAVSILLCDENMMYLSGGRRSVETAGDKDTFTPSVLSEIKYPNYNSSAISIALFRFDDESKVEAGASQIMSAMVTKGYYPDSFLVVSMNTIAGMVSSVMDILTLMLSVIAGISLVVGGIGIMNIMLVTVSERTREIGIRKAIGAKRSSILLQFLIEALVVTIIGGLIGIIISLIGTAIIGHFMGISLIMPAWVFALSLGFSVAIGVIFGMYPAIKAARMHPIDALRHD